MKDFQPAAEGMRSIKGLVAEVKQTRNRFKGGFTAYKFEYLTRQLCRSNETTSSKQKHWPYQLAGRRL